MSFFDIQEVMKPSKMGQWTKKKKLNESFTKVQKFYAIR